MWHENYRWHFDYARLAYDAGFSFENRKLQASLDQAKLGLIDVETVIREKDVSTLERFISLVTEFCLEGEQVKVLDQSFVKVFRISQLIIEYLLFCKKYLDNTVVLLKKELSNSAQESKELKSNLKELKSETNSLKRRIKDIECSPPAEVATFRCNECSKAFAAEEYLFAHVKRRHETSNTAYQEETNKLQLEIKELKERLNITERLVQQEQTNEKDVDVSKALSYSKLEELQQKFEILRTHVENELKLLHTQKEFQEKYEKLFEVTISNTRAAFVEAESLKNKLQSNSSNNLEKKSSSTQTDLDVEETIGDNRIAQKHETEDAAEVQINVERLQRDLMTETQQQINKVEGVLEEMVANHLGKIENQVQTALEKLSVRTTKSSEELKQSLPKTPQKCVKSAQMQGNEMDSSPTKDAAVASSKLNIETIEVPNIVSLHTSNGKVINKEKVLILESETEDDLQSETEASPEKPKQLEKYEQSKNPILNEKAFHFKKEVPSKKVLVDLHAKFERCIEKKLQEIGVSPEWNGLPNRSFLQALTVINHQAMLYKKNFPDYLKVRKKLVKDMLKKVKAQSNMNSVNSKRIAKVKQKAVKKEKNKVTIKLYDSDTESADDENPAPKSDVITKTVYDSVIKELKGKRPVPDPDVSSELTEEIEMKAKSSLKNEMQHTERKKVMFKVENGGKNLVDSPLLKTTKGGSSTSIPSSIFDAPKLNLQSKDERKKDVDISDWEISDISD